MMTIYCIVQMIRTLGLLHTDHTVRMSNR